MLIWNDCCFLGKKAHLLQLLSALINSTWYLIFAIKCWNKVYYTMESCSHNLQFYSGNVWREAMPNTPHLSNIECDVSTKLLLGFEWVKTKCVDIQWEGLQAHGRCPWQWTGLSWIVSGRFPFPCTAWVPPISTLVPPNSTAWFSVDLKTD